MTGATARAVLAAALLLIVLAGCGPKRTSRRPPKPPKPGATEAGVASWYGHPYHGRRAANGEVYDMDKMTAAHRTLPFDTWVRVQNLSNRKTAEVRITDRGPFIRGRIIDLSRAAAREIGLIGPGVAKVRIVVIRPPPAPRSAVFAVQVGAFRDRANAERIRAEMEARYGTARLVERPGDTLLWRVLVGALETEAGAEQLAARIASEGNAGATAFVVRL